MSAQVGHVFATPVIVDTLPDFPALNAALAEVARAEHARHPGVTRSNWNGWQSTADMLAWGGPAAHVLARHFLTLCDRYTHHPNPEADPLSWRVDMWANVSPPSGANEAHCHPGAVWSAVYYIEDGYDGSPDPMLGGELMLYDPRMPAIRMLPFDLRYRTDEGDVPQSHMSLRPTNGRLVMFPPWLMHSVRPYRGRLERISIAMNANAVRDARQL